MTQAATKYKWIAKPLRGLAVPLADLNLDPSNARTHSERNIDTIVASLDRWGQRSPIVVQKEGMVVRAGNGRLVAAKRLGWSHMAAVVVDEGSVEATAFAIADNRTSDLASFDDEALASLLGSLGPELSEVAGFSDADLSELLADLTPDFQPVGEDDQSRLDEKNPTVCPECGHIWTA